ncbi:MAG: OmpW family protein [Phycisphaerae bacterium]|nr:OmpW family protein [Phycisphaerae bacterium]
MKDAPRFTKVVFIAICAFVVAGILPYTAMAQAGESPWMIRARILGVEPDDDSSTITVIGGKAKVDDSVTVDVDFSYFFTDNVAAELTLTVSPHDVEAVHIPGVGKYDLGDVKLLPPTLTLQYHFIPDGKLRPYVGAGVNYTIFFDDDPGTASSIDYDNAFGFALQAGFDVGINENWAINFDVKKIWLDTDVSAKTALGTVKTKVDIDPWLFGVGLAYRF